MNRVILMLDYSSEFDRRLIRGMVQYTNENGQWVFNRISSERVQLFHNPERLVELARKWKADAIVGRFDEEEIKCLEELNIPIVVQNYRNRSVRHSNITGDYKGAGEMAAEYFYKKRYSSYAFFGIRGVVWSDERMAGYKEGIDRFGGQFTSYEIEMPGHEDMEEIASWLHTLPDHTALFCCDDAHALMITETCKLENIEIPRQIAVLGVNNDDLRCFISDPPISSIELNVEQGGYLLCKLLHNQIENPDSSPFGVVINPVTIRERKSSSSFNVDDPFVLKVVNHINDNYTANIFIKDILDMIPLSRRSLESRFKKAMGMGIYQYVIFCRIERVAQLLATTDKTLVEIASEAGIQEYNNLAGQFRRIKGCSPKEYRTKRCVIYR